ncbi:MAG: NUDIX domain-containing protein [Candidatus Liptonbacteria bacterium]|nr:NUDIX domain-containing protein [Candidatus Liptonbacteria bacterium]
MTTFVPKPGQVDYTHAARAPVINCVVEHDGKILLVKRSRKLNLHPGVWNGVSGFLDDGKSPMEKAKEELLEEAGISPEQIISMEEGKVFEVRDGAYGKTWVTHPVHVKVATDAVKLDWEAEEYRWVAPAEIKGLALTPGFLNVLDQFFGKTAHLSSPRTRGSMP